MTQYAFLEYHITVMQESKYITSQSKPLLGANIKLMNLKMLIHCLWYQFKDKCSLKYCFYLKGKKKNLQEFHYFPNLFYQTEIHNKIL